MGNTEITVVDAIMGSGKTSAAINFMEANCDKFRFLFITPYLEEVGRIQESCPLCRFTTPKEFGTKLNSLKQLLKRGDNIASTHALFNGLDDEAIEAIRNGKYILFMDEVLEVVAPFSVISKYDLQMLVDAGMLHLREDGSVSWEKQEYDGVFKRFKQSVEKKHIIWLNESEDSDGYEVFPYSLYSIFDTRSFSCFQKIFVLTYLFEGSILKAYFDLYGCSYCYLGTEKRNDMYQFCENVSASSTNKTLIQKITLWETQKNPVGLRPEALCYSWFHGKGKENPQIKQLKQNITNFFINIAKTKSKHCLWTTFKSSKDKLSGAGYARGFEVHNARATNKHKDKTAVVYAVNKYANPIINHFFALHGVEIDQDMYALSSMLQFIWRSAIREGKDIWVYIPSLRMQRLFEDWLLYVGGETNPEKINKVVSTAGKNRFPLTAPLRREAERMVIK